MNHRIIVILWLFLTLSALVPTVVCAACLESSEGKLQAGNFKKVIAGVINAYEQKVPNGEIYSVIFSNKYYFKICNEPSQIDAFMRKWAYSKFPNGSWNPALKTDDKTKIITAMRHGVYRTKKVKNVWLISEFSNSKKSKQGQVKQTQKLNNDKHSGDNTIKILSIPNGLDVYVLPAKGTLNFNDLFKQENLRGKTPLAVKTDENNLIIGILRYYPIIIESNPIQNQSAWEVTGMDFADYPFFLDRNNLIKNGKLVKEKVIRGILFKQGRPSAVGLARIYAVNTNNRDQLISLHYPANLEIENLDDLYPSNAKYIFKDDDISKDMLSYNVPEKLIIPAIKLLHKGGKVALTSTDQAIVIVEILSSDKWDIYRIKNDKAIK